MFREYLGVTVEVTEAARLGNKSRQTEAADGASEKRMEGSRQVQASEIKNLADKKSSSRPILRHNRQGSPS